MVANISLSLDGRVAGPGGDYDMSWIVPHAVTDGARDHMVKVTSAATTALLGRKNYQGFSSYWPAVAEDESADPRDRAFARLLVATVLRRLGQIDALIAHCLNTPLPPRAWVRN